MNKMRDDFSLLTRIFSIRTKDDTATYFSKYLAEIAPRKGKSGRNDGGGEFSKRDSGALCTIEKTRQEPDDSRFPQYNDVAERQIAIIEAEGIGQGFRQ